MRVLVACEFSGVVRRAFAEMGHDAYSCDLIPSEDNSPNHIICDVTSILADNWDLMIAHPPCTHLSVSGARWCTDHWVKRKSGSYFHDATAKRIAREAAAQFFMALINANIPKIAVENPVCIMSTRYQRPTQIIQPWQFGHGETKATCLWLKHLPPLIPTNIVNGRENRVFQMPPSPTRHKDRARTYSGIAQAMAEQWS